MDCDKIPVHVGIIMDGNRRWATAHGKSPSYGHKAGADNIRDVAAFLFEKGVKVISLYAFSTENFLREKTEVDQLMSLLKSGLKKYGDYARKNKVRLTISGDMRLLSDDLQQIIAKESKKTIEFTDKTLNICLAYGGRQEICHAFSRMIDDKVQSVTPETVEKYLYTSDFPPLDYIIRTGGEYRLSNFLLWQSAYAELYFTPVLWPDFNRAEAERALASFSERTRRFGKN